MRSFRIILGAVLVAWILPTAATAAEFALQSFPVPAGSHPHDVAPARKGGIVWYTAQLKGALGMLEPDTGRTRHIPLGDGSAPHGVIIGPDGAPWITDGGLNAIVRVDPVTFEIRTYPLPKRRGDANLNTGVFDAKGVYWFTGQSGIYGRLELRSGAMTVFDAPGGPGPYGIAATPHGAVYYASLAGSHIARIDTSTGAATVIEPPTRDQGARRVWNDSKGLVWVSEWNAGQVSVYDPAKRSWRSWKLPGEQPHAYAVYVDERDKVWLSDFAGNAVVRFDPVTEKFDVIPLPRPGAAVRQILGRRGEIWLPESGTDHITVIRWE
jgi:virginiamycin B lyase